MCTVVLLHRPGHRWPLLLAANRDERLERPWDPPAPWPDGSGLVAGRDRLGGGTWMAVGHRVAAAVLNRQGSLGPAPGKRSRGRLPLLAAGQGTPERGAAAVAALDAGNYRSFNLVMVGLEGAWFVRGVEAGRPEAAMLAPGLHMVTAHDPDDPASPRVRRHLPRFEAAEVPEPPDWGEWAALLLDGSGPAGTELHVPPREGFGTVSSSLLAIGADGGAAWWFAARDGRFAPVAMA